MIVLLTLLTQTGGVLLLIAIGLWRWFKWEVAWARLGSFVALYLLVNFTLVPLLARSFDKRPLPLGNEHIRAQNWLLVLSNRHYVHEDLYDLLMKVGEQYQQRYPDHRLVYMDAAFPLGHQYPLPPHRAHFDGKAIDLAFAYREAKSDELLSRAPNQLGYGRYEKPKEGEPDWPTLCGRDGNSFYSISKVFAWRSFPDVSVDVSATRYQIRLFAEAEATSRIFLEPHLKQRWRLMNQERIRFHGCKAVRHDDHYHLSVR